MWYQKTCPYNGQGRFWEFSEDEVCQNGRFPGIRSTFPAPTGCHYVYFLSGSVTGKWPKSKKTIFFRKHHRYIGGRYFWLSYMLGPQDLRRMKPRRHCQESEIEQRGRVHVQEGNQRHPDQISSIKCLPLKKTCVFLMKGRESGPKAEKKQRK